MAGIMGSTGRCGKRGERKNKKSGKGSTAVTILEAAVEMSGIVTREEEVMIVRVMTENVWTHFPSTF